jgi:hypothetical protein
MRFAPNYERKKENMKKTTKWLNKMAARVFAVALAFIFTFSPLTALPSLLSPTPAAAASMTLGDLPIGSVIQIMPKDTTMCAASSGQPTNCSTTTSEVLPFKFVKMQARDSSGQLINNQGYSYWVLMDNYCWWGSSNCQYLGARSSAYQSFNHDNGTAAGSAPTNFHNNISIQLANNILKPMANFYVTLPDNIGNDTTGATLTKAQAIPNFAWDMMPTSSANPSVAGWGSTQGSWTAGTYNPASNADSQFVFSGSNTAPVMTSKIGLLSYTEWQGGLFAYGVYPTAGSLPQVAAGKTALGSQVFSRDAANTQTLAALGNYGSAGGNGATFSLARYGSSNTALVADDCNPTTPTCTGTSYKNTYNPDTGYSGKTDFAYNQDDGTVAYLQLQGPANPRVRHPWFRTATSDNASHVWYVAADSAAGSVYTYPAYSGFGVSPALWLKSNVLVAEGSGTYNEPYCLSGAYCPGKTSAVFSSAPSGALAAGTSLTITGTVQGSDVYDGDILSSARTTTDANAWTANTAAGFHRSKVATVTAKLCNTLGECVSKAQTVNIAAPAVSGNYTLTWTSDELPTGLYSGTVLVYNSAGSGAETGAVSFSIPTKEIAVKAVKGKPFNIKLATAANDFAGLTSACSTTGLAVTKDASGAVYATSTGGLTAATSVTCAGTKVSVAVVEAAMPSVSEVAIY